MLPDPAALLKDEQRIKNELAKVTLKAWSDKAFAHLLINNPKAALDQIGVDFGDHINPSFHIDTGTERHFVIPLSPANYIGKDVQYHLERLAILHAEVTSTVSWSPVTHPER